VEYHTYLDAENKLDSQAITRNEEIITFLPGQDILPSLLEGRGRGEKEKTVSPIVYI